MPAGTKPGYQIERENGLTKREREVLGQIAQGHNVVQTAHALGVSKQRVDQILRSLVTKGRVTRDGVHFTIVVER